MKRGREEESNGISNVIPANEKKEKMNLLICRCWKFQMFKKLVYTDIIF